MYYCISAWTHSKGNGHYYEVPNTEMKCARQSYFFNIHSLNLRGCILSCVWFSFPDNSGARSKGELCLVDSWTATL